jgi:hypothetical protein
MNDNELTPEEQTTHQEDHDHINERLTKIEAVSIIAQEIN